MRPRNRKEFESDNRRLRKQFGGDDSFMTGHQIKKIRTRAREIPTWTNNNAAVQKVLLRAFPKCRTHRRQRCRAARWSLIIHLFFRMQLTTGHIARDLQIKPKTVENTIASIRRVARGYRADNKGPRGLRSPGRPSKTKGNSN